VAESHQGLWPSHIKDYGTSSQWDCISGEQSDQFETSRMSTNPDRKLSRKLIRELHTGVSGTVILVPRPGRRRRGTWRID